MRQPVLRRFQYLTLFLVGISLTGCVLGKRTTPSYVTHAKQMWRKGISALESGEADKAESWLRKAAEVIPENGTTQRHLAEALWQGGKHQEAIAHAEEACRCTPSSSDTIIRAGEMCLASGAIDRAHHWGNRAIEINAQSPSAWGLRGRSHMKLGQIEQALADFQQALRYAPNDPQLLSDVASLHKARGDHRRCLTALHQVLDAYPPGQEPSEALAMAGEAYLSLGRSQEAIEALRLATTRGSANADLLCRLAEAQAACGNKELAVADARKALSLDSEHADSQALLARLAAASSSDLR